MSVFYRDFEKVLPGISGNCRKLISMPHTSIVPSQIIWILYENIYKKNELSIFYRVFEKVLPGISGNCGKLISINFNAAHRHRPKSNHMNFIWKRQQKCLKWTFFTVNLKRFSRKFREIARKFRKSAAIWFKRHCNYRLNMGTTYSHINSYKIHMKNWKWIFFTVFFCESFAGNFGKLLIQPGCVFFCWPLLWALL